MKPQQQNNERENSLLVRAPRQPVDPVQLCLFPTQSQCLRKSTLLFTSIIPMMVKLSSEAEWTRRMPTPHPATGPVTHTEPTLRSAGSAANSQTSRQPDSQASNYLNTLILKINLKLQSRHHSHQLAYSNSSRSVNQRTNLLRLCQVILKKSSKNLLNKRLNKWENEKVCSG